MFTSLFHGPQSFRRALRWPGVVCLVLGWAQISRATTVVPPEFSTLVNASDYIVHAVVKSVNAEKRTTAKGFKIVTLVQLDVIEVVAGVPPPAITLELLGGRVGKEELTVQGQPQFRVGDEDILFISGNGRAFCPLYAMGHGRYPVLTDAATGLKYVARADLGPLRAAADVSLPLAEAGIAAVPGQRAASTAALAPAAFIRDIRAGIAADNFKLNQRAP